MPSSCKKGLSIVCSRDVWSTLHTRHLCVSARNLHEQFEHLENLFEICVHFFCPKFLWETVNVRCLKKCTLLKYVLEMYKVFSHVGFYVVWFIFLYTISKNILKVKDINIKSLLLLLLLLFFAFCLQISCILKIYICIFIINIIMFLGSHTTFTCTT